MLKTIRRLFSDVGLTEGFALEDGYHYTISERAAAKALGVDMTLTAILIADIKQETMIDIMGVINAHVLSAAGMDDKHIPERMPIINATSQDAFKKLVGEATELIKSIYAEKYPTSRVTNMFPYGFDIQTAVTQTFCETKVRLRREFAMMHGSKLEIIQNALEATGLTTTVPPRRLIRSGLIPEDTAVLTPEIALTAAKKYAELRKNPSDTAQDVSINNKNF